MRRTVNESALRELIFDEAVRNLDPHTAEQLAQTINLLKGKVTILFITHQLPKGLMVDEVVRLAGQYHNEQTHQTTQNVMQTSNAEIIE